MPKHSRMYDVGFNNFHTQVHYRVHSSKIVSNELQTWDNKQLLCHMMFQMCLRRIFK